MPLYCAIRDGNEISRVGDYFNMSERALKN
jgi:hypothetical protein